MTQNLIRAPFFAQLDGRALKISVILLQLAFEASQQRKRVGSGASETRQECCRYKGGEPSSRWPS